MAETSGSTEVEAQHEHEKAVKDLYAAIAEDGKPLTTDRTHALDPVGHTKSTGYSDQELSMVPEAAVMGLGCGNPTALAQLREGEAVLDLGCGGGLDAFLAAHRVGERGRVLGVDVTPEMIDKARENARIGHYKNVEFQAAEIERLPVEDGSFNVVISNCVLNHCSDKRAAFTEVFRALKPGGRISVADLVTVGEFSGDMLQDEVWGEWLAAASPEHDYLDAIVAVGFRDVTVETKGSFAMAEADERLAGRILSIQVSALK